MQEYILKVHSPSYQPRSMNQGRNDGRAEEIEIRAMNEMQHNKHVQ